jgi:hypothetical protein
MQLFKEITATTQVSFFALRFDAYELFSKLVSTN